MQHVHPSNLLAHCPLCQAAYDEKQVRLVGEKGTTRLFHCTCQSCGHAMLALVLESQGALSSVGLVTDLEIQDAMRFMAEDSITSDDCLKTHRILQDESKDFCRLLTKA